MYFDPSFADLQAFRPMLDNGSFILGQKQEELNGGFDAGQAFSGRVANIVLLDHAIEIDDIRLLADDR